MTLATLYRDFSSFRCIRSISAPMLVNVLSHRCFHISVDSAVLKFLGGQPMHILIIDDDEDSCNTLTDFLQYENYAISSTKSPLDGLRLAHQVDPGLVILDVKMPTMNGWEVCQNIRSFSDVPILMISAHFTQIRHMVQGLDMGADGYLAKPLDFDLLKAKVRALIRRKSDIARHRTRSRYVDPYLSIDLHSKQIRLHGQSVTLSPLEYQLLEMLVLNIDHAVPMVEIIEELWPNIDCLADSSRNRVYACIKTLRQSIEPDPGDPHYIVSEHGFGYRFVSCT